MTALNLDLDYFGHPKTVRLVEILGKGSDVLPLRLWTYVGKYHGADGRLTGISASEIESKVAWWGAAGSMVKAMIEVGFIDVAEGGYQIHNWLQRAGHIPALQDRAREAANARWFKLRNSPKDASPGGKQCSGLPLPSPLPPPKAPPPKGGGASSDAGEAGNGQDNGIDEEKITEEELAEVLGGFRQRIHAKKPDQIIDVNSSKSPPETTETLELKQARKLSIV